MPSRAADITLSLPLTGGKTVETVATHAPARGTIADLTRRLAAGEEEAFRKFHELYFDRLYHFLLVVCHGQALEAQEALQQSLLRVVRYARIFECEAAFWSWLKVLARSSARDAGRKQRRYFGLLEKFAHRVELEKAEQTASEDSALRRALEECLGELEPNDRRLLESKYVDGSTMGELSTAECSSERAIESRLYRLRRQLREQVLKKLRSS